MVIVIFNFITGSNSSSSSSSSTCHDTGLISQISGPCINQYLFIVSFCLR